MSIDNYNLKIKELCNDDEMVQICLGGLTPQFSAIQSAVLAREKSPSFFDLQSMLLVEENHVRTRGNTYDGHMLYTNSEEGRVQGNGRRVESSQGRTSQRQPREQNFYKCTRWSVRKKGEQPCHTELTE